MQVQSLGREDPWRRKWQRTPVFLSGESPWTDEPGGLQSKGHKELDTTERLNNNIRIPVHPWEAASSFVRPRLPLCSLNHNRSYSFLD